MSSPGGAPGEWLVTPGDHAVDVPVVCVLTRFGLRSARHLLPVYRDYRRVVNEAAEHAGRGLLRSAFLIESPVSCYSLSLWTGLDAIARFGTHVPAHVRAGNNVFGHLALNSERGPELWSTKWRLMSVSHNLNWEDFDLRAFLATAMDSPRC